jgi:signal transduction histidine kinase
VKILELVVGALCLLGVAAAWTFAIRTIRRQRRELDAHMLRIETAMSDLDAFAGRVAHDLRNAVSPLSMVADSLKLNAAKPEAVEIAAQRVQRASARTTALLDALLAFSRAGKPSDERGASSVKEEVQACIEELHPQAERMRATVEVELTDDLRFAISSALLNAVVANLLGNALKFLDGRERREVRITARPDEGRGLLIVEDTGPGIPVESLPKVFEPFYRVPGTSAPGTGIGLATVHRIIQAHGGQIQVMSVPGEGARFEVRLPLAQTGSS